MRYPTEYDSRRGSGNGRWKGGRFIHPTGYWLIRKLDHPFRRKSGYVMLHRYVWEQHNNAILLPWGGIHHINGDKLDNRIENLHAMMKRQHSHLHGKKNKPSLAQRKAISEAMIRYWNDWKHQRKQNRIDEMNARRNPITGRMEKKK